MAKRIFEADLSVKGVQKLKEDLLRYKNDEFKDKCVLLVNRLAENGLNVALERVNSSPVGKNVTIRVESATRGTNVAKIMGSGTINQAEGREPFYLMLAIEYGSGIYYNVSGNPDAVKMGYGPGTFPGQIHAFEDGWYYWDEKTQTWRYTHGIKATMPMYAATLKIRETVESVVREVFG